MSLYSYEPTRKSKKNFFQIGFTIMGISGLVVALENLVVLYQYGARINLGGILDLALASLVGTLFAIISLRYLRKKYNGPLVWLLFSFTLVAWLGHLIPILLPFEWREYLVRYMDIRQVSSWLKVIGITGAPIDCILGLFNLFIKSNFNLIFYHLDYAIRLLFFGAAIIRYSKINHDISETSRSQLIEPHVLHGQ